MKIPITKIVIDERMREELRGTKEEWTLFRNSFSIHGQLQPIRVEQREDGKYRLIAGERRMTAITELHVEKVKIPNLDEGEIEVTFAEPVPLHKRLMQEFAENNQRKDFTYVERAKFIRKFHERMQLEYGADAWSQELTARTLNVSRHPSLTICELNKPFVRIQASRKPALLMQQSRE
jgi:ParB/RepB/Spo0J family partition protein